MSSTQHLNPEVIQELRQVMGSEFAGLLQTFIIDSGQRMAAISEALQSANADMLRRAAHSFKGSTGNMGAQHMAELCRQLEELARGGTTEGAAELFIELSAEFAAVQREVGALPR